MSRRRRRRGPGGRSGMGRGRPRRTIIITSVSPTGTISKSSPTIRAVVEDRKGYLLSRRDIDVYVDGEWKRSQYRRSTGQLICAPGRLSPGAHTVEIEATVEEDDDGGGRTGRKRWTFSIQE